MNSLDIKKLRIKLGVTQKELALLTGNSERTIINYEKGKVIPKTKHAIFHNLLNRIEPETEYYKPPKITNQQPNTEMTEIELLKRMAENLFMQLDQKEKKITQLESELKECKESERVNSL